MTGEIITMIGVGLALAAFNWRVMVRLENRLDSRFDRLDGRIGGLKKEVHELGREFSELRGEIRGGRT